MPATRRTKDDACRMLVVAMLMVGRTYNTGQADQQRVRCAILKMDSPVIWRRDAVVYQAIYCLYNKRVYEEAEKLKSGNCRSSRICDGADVGRTQSARLD